MENLSRTIEEASALALAGVGAELSFDLRVVPDAAEAFIDRIQIQQVLLNLIRNAVEAMAGSAHQSLVIATLPSTGAMVELSVADSGPGIAEADKPRVTERFYRGNRAAGTEGIGLGLSVVDAVARLHGGSLAFNDRGPGLEAILTLPRDAD